MKMCARAMWIKNFVLFSMIQVIAITCNAMETELDSTAESYNHRIDITVLTEKSSKNITLDLLEKHQVGLVQKMTDHRLQVVLHGDRSFGNNDNVQWHECVRGRKADITNLSESYAQDEAACSRVALADVREKNRGVKQILKQISEWRRGYKYLIKQCKAKHPLDITKTEMCLDEYVKKDNYDETLSKLLSLLEEAQTSLKNTAKESLSSLVSCLDEALSNYLEGVRVLKNKLSRCYGSKIKLNPIVAEIRKPKCVP